MEMTELYFAMKVYGIIAAMMLLAIFVLVCVISYAVDCVKERKKEKQRLRNLSKSKANSKF